MSQRRSTRRAFATNPNRVRTTAGLRRSGPRSTRQTDCDNRVAPLAFLVEALRRCDSQLFRKCGRVPACSSSGTLLGRLGLLLAHDLYSKSATGRVRSIDFLCSMSWSVNCGWCPECNVRRTNEHWNRGWTPARPSLLTVSTSTSGDETVSQRSVTPEIWSRETYSFITHSLDSTSIVESNR